MKLLLASTVLLLSAADAAYAQKAAVWKHVQRPDLGVTLRFFSIAGSDSTASNDIENRINVVGLGAIAGLNLPFAELSDEFSIGFNPNVVAATALSMLSTIDLEFPLYVTLKYGTDATWSGSKSWIGATVGAGYQYNVIIPLNWGYGAITFGRPSVMGELNFGKRRGGLGLIKLRYSMALGSHTETYLASGQEYSMVMTQHAFDLIITQNF